MGTPQFMAPEQAEGKVDEIDARSDIFSLGAILYNILTLRPPVNVGTVAEVLQKVRTGDIPSPTSYNPKSRSVIPGRLIGTGRARMPNLPLPHCPDQRIPSALSAVCMKALALRREDRYQSVKELQKDIDAFQGGFATFAEQAGTLRLFWLLIKRHKTLFLVSLAALLIVVIVSVAFSIRNAATLRHLRATAPEFYTQAVALVGQQKFDDALRKISYAIELTPERAEYQFLQGNILETLLRIEPARAAYEQALRYDSTHAKARENLELCKKLLQTSAGQQPIPTPALHELYLAMRRQERFVEAQVILQKLGSRLGLETAMTVLKEAGIGGKLQVDPEGLLTLDLSYTGIKDISPLRGLPLKELYLDETQVSDLSPLRGMPLRKLNLSHTQVSDLSPLEGMALENLSLTATPVRDLSPLRGMPLRGLLVRNTNLSDISPLKGMPLESLDLVNSQVTDLSVLKGMPLIYLALSYTRIIDISVLRGMPLKELLMEKCENLQDLTPLADCQQLELLIIPSQCKDIEFLRTMPNLKRIAYTYAANRTTVPTAAEFWKEYDAKKQKEGGR